MKIRSVAVEEKLTIARAVAERLVETPSIRASARKVSEQLGVSAWTAIKYFYQLRDNEARGVKDPYADISAFRIGSEHVNLVRRKRYRERIDQDPEFVARTRRLRLESAARHYIPYAIKRGTDLLFFCRRLIAFARNRTGGLEPIDIEAADLEAIYERQQGICPLTGLEMQLTASPRHPLLPSLDRIEPRGGYSRENVRFVCYFANLLKRDFSDTDVAMLLSSIRTKAPEQGPLPDPKAVDNKLRGCFRNAMRRTRDYKWTTDLHISDLHRLYYTQMGRCAITGCILAAVPVTPYSISIDRIDSSKHYTKDNIHLVCLSINIAKLDHPLPAFLEILNSAGNVSPGIPRANPATHPHLP